MAERTGIQWADATWNPWMGCKKVSPGCRECYMFRDMKRYGRNPSVVSRASDKTMCNPLRWDNKGMLHDRARIFTCSWSDWFIEQADEWRDAAWSVIRMTPQFDYLILTKRPERITAHLPDDWGEGWNNVWLIVSAEDQKHFDERWSILQGIPSKVRGISAEPLLGEIHLWKDVDLHWVITGGESGAKSRWMNPVWATTLQRECAERGIPFFHKQNGGAKKIDGAWGGRKLDGQIYDGFPASQ